MHFHTVVARGSSWAATIVAWLLFKSQWFQVTPMPDDEWEITVRTDFGAHLDEFVKE